MESWYARWTRNGRLSGLAFLAVGGPWLGLLMAGHPVDPQHTNMVLVLFGIFSGNLALRKEKEELSDKKRLSDVEYVTRKVVSRDILDAQAVALEAKQDVEELKREVRGDDAGAAKS